MFLRTSRIREKVFASAIRKPESFEVLANWRLDCFNHIEELPGRDGQIFYVRHSRMRGVRGPGIHPKHFPIRALRPASRDRMED
jgi:hypothetical protein